MASDLAQILKLCLSCLEQKPQGDLQMPQQQQQQQQGQHHGQHHQQQQHQHPAPIHLTQDYPPHQQQYMASPPHKYQHRLVCPVCSAVACGHLMFRVPLSRMPISKTSRTLTISSYEMYVLLPRRCLSPRYTIDHSQILASAHRRRKDGPLP